MNALRIPSGFVASCQPVRGGLFDEPDLVRRYANVCEAAGARSLRLESLRDIQVVRPSTELPIIGLVKHAVPGSDVFITPEEQDVRDVIEAGADVVALDATMRPRPVPVETLVRIALDAGHEVMADVATFEEGVAAWEAGCSYVGTTLSGYVPGTPDMEGPDLELVERLAQAGVRTIAEGRYATPSQAAEAMARGAYGVTIGTAISRPELLAQAFAEAIQTGS